MHVVFKILGVKAFQKMSLLHNMVSVARRAIYHHFEQITKVFLQDNTKANICSNVKVLFTEDYLQGFVCRN